MVEPAYQELLKSDIPHVSKDGVHVAVIAGQSYGANVSVSLIIIIATSLIPRPLLLSWRSREEPGDMSSNSL